LFANARLSNKKQKLDARNFICNSEERFRYLIPIQYRSFIRDVYYLLKLVRKQSNRIRVLNLLESQNIENKFHAVQDHIYKMK